MSAVEIPSREGSHRLPAIGRQYRGQSPDARKADRRRRLLAAGLELYGTAGYAATTITDICRKAGVAPSHFYEEFPTRESLLAALYEDIVEATRTNVVSAIAGCPPNLAVRTRAGLHAYCHTLLDDPRVARVKCAEVVGVSREMEILRTKGLETFADIMIAEFVSALEGISGLGPLPETRYLKSVAVTLVGGANEGMLEWLLDEDRVSMEQLLEIFIGTFLATAEWVMKSTMVSTAPPN